MPNCVKATDMQKHEPNWAVYQSLVDSKFSVIAVDLNFQSKAPISIYPNVLWFSVRFNAVKERGMPTQPEVKAIQELEDVFIPMVLRELKSVYVGRLTSNGARDYYFYATQSEFTPKLITWFKEKYPKRQFQHGGKKDSDWSGYLDFLYPKARQLQTIMNERVIENLLKSGDSLKNKRRIDHMVYFKTKANRQAFLTEIQKLGFSKISEQDDIEDEKWSFSLNFDRKDAATEDSIERIFDAIWPLVEKYKADYDGWGCEIAP